MSETALYEQIGLLQGQLTHAKQIIEELTKERNKFRSQAMMRQAAKDALQDEVRNLEIKVQHLEQQLERAYE
jgi:uncharacterized coiled-coil DUF342 family protein